MSAGKTCSKCPYFLPYTGYCTLLSVKVTDPSNPPCTRGQDPAGNAKASLSAELQQEEPVSEKTLPAAASGVSLGAVQRKLSMLVSQVKRYFVGYEDLVKLLVVSLLSEGHVLIEGPSGTGKTLLAKVFAMSIGGKFSRIQMTPDLLPADIVGNAYYDLQSGEWKLRLGPIHANVVFIDELNRATTRTQSALLEAMQERQVSIEGRTIPLPRPFLVIATMIPEGEGTYPLPILAIDRFSFSTRIPGPDPEVEKEVLRRVDLLDELNVKPVLAPEEVLAAAALARRVKASDKVLDYIVSLVDGVRKAEEVDVKPSTRAAVWMLKGARALALLEGRNYVLPDDVKTIAPYVLRHRVSVKPDYALDGVAPEEVVRRVLGEVEVPKA